MIQPIRVDRCWCGSSDIKEFSSDYVKCPVCETVILSKWPHEDVFKVKDDENDFYGQHYYQAYIINKYGYPNLAERARGELSERCLHWLKTVLKYKLPPGRTLELGSSHGGFVALLKWAGFESQGLELSPWLVKYSSEIFGVPILTGPIEHQSIENESLDVIAMLDVLEHLTDPVSTMRHCLKLLKPDGIILIQTPRYPAGKSFEEMRAKNDAFLEQLKPSEHLYLFSKEAIRSFFHQLDVQYIEFEPAIFDRYDMFLVVSRRPFLKNISSERVQALCSSPSGRLIQTIIDISSRAKEDQS